MLNVHINGLFARSCREGGAHYRGRWRPMAWFEKNQPEDAFSTFALDNSVVVSAGTRQDSRQLRSRRSRPLPGRFVQIFSCCRKPKWNLPGPRRTTCMSTQREFGKHDRLGRAPYDDLHPSCQSRTTPVLCFIMLVDCYMLGYLMGTHMWILSIGTSMQSINRKAPSTDDRNFLLSYRSVLRIFHDAIRSF